MRRYDKGYRVTLSLALLCRPLTFACFAPTCPASVEPSPCMRMLACKLFTRIAYISSCASYAHCVYMTYEQRAVAQQETDR